MTTIRTPNIASNRDVSLWLDGLRRGELESEQIHCMVASGGLVGAVFNPTTFHQEITSGGYDGQLADLAAGGHPVDDALRHLVAEDGRRAADVLRAAFEATGGVDGLVTVGIPPQRAVTTSGIVSEAEQLRALIDRPNVLVAVPPSPDGLAAAGQLVAAGTNVSITPVFSPERYRQAVEVVIAGLEVAKTRGHDLSSLLSTVSVAISPVDTEVDKLLWKIGTDDSAALRGRAALANARLVHREHQKLSEVAAGKGARVPGARPPRLVWIAAAPSDPYYGPTHYVDDLTMPGVACAVNQVTHEAMTDADLSSGGGGAAAEEDTATVVARFSAVGVDHGAVVRSLDDRGVTRFNRSWEELWVSVQSRLDRH